VNWLFLSGKSCKHRIGRSPPNLKTLRMREGGRLGSTLHRKQFWFEGEERPTVLRGVFPSSPPIGISTRARHLLQGRSLWVAGMVGLGIALPSVDYLAVLAVILASGAPPAAQAVALLTFNAVAFSLVEIPLISYLAAPDKTRALMEARHQWSRRDPRRRGHRRISSHPHSG
jgi:hypothetical protein